MVIFTSDRERRLWGWALAAVLAIYSTLGPAATVVSYLRDRNLLRVSLVLLLILILGLIGRQWFRHRPKLSEVGLALGVMIVYFLVGIRINSLEERTHLIEYSVVALLILQALGERSIQGVRAALLALIMTSALGLLDEGIQALLPNRVFDPVDVGFNTLAGLMAVSAYLLFGWLRRWRGAKPDET